MTIDARVEMFYSDQWNTITGDADMDAGIAIGYGRPDEHSEAVATSCALTLEDRDGDYRPLDPTAALYELVGLGTRVRVGIGASQTAMMLDGDDESYASTPDHSSLDVTGDIDIRMELVPTSWTPELRTVLAGKYDTTANQKSWALRVLETGHLDLLWTTDGTSGTVATRSSTTVVPTGTRAVRVTLDVDNGLGGNDTTFYTSTAIDGSWTQLGSVLTGSGATSIFSSTAELTVGALRSGAVESADEVRLSGRVYAFELRDGIGGPAVANPDFTTMGTEDTILVDGAGRTWTVHDAAWVADVSLRSHTEVISWTPQVDVTALDVRQSIDSRGILERLGTDDEPLSALERFVVGDASAPEGYWPLDDGNLATSARVAAGSNGIPAIMNNVPGGSLLQKFAFGTGDLATWLKPCAEIVNSARLRCGLVAPVSTHWTVHWAVRFNGKYNAAHTDGAIMGATDLPAFTVTFQSSTFQLDIAGPAGPSVANITVPDLYDGAVHHMAFRAEQNGGATDWLLVIDGATASSGSIGATTVPLLGRFLFQQNGNDEDSRTRAVGHVGVYSGDGPAVADVYEAMFGHPGERAGRRLLRVCTQRDIAFEHIGDLDATAAMGPQRSIQVLDVIEECRAADLGLVYEPRRPALGYRTHEDLSSQSPALVLDMATGAVVNPFSPPLDAARIHNDITVSRQDGSLARAVKETGPGSVASVGRRPDNPTINIETDEKLADQASWRLHVGTVVGHRIAVLEVEMHHHPELQQAVLDLRPGDLIRLTNPTPGLPPGPIDLLALGWTDTITDETWQWACHCIPASPYHILTWDNPDHRWDAVGSVLHEDLDTTETGVDVAVGAQERWTTDMADFPLDVMVGGERLTVASIADTLVTGLVANADVIGNNASLNPTIHASAVFGNLLLLPAAIRNSGTGTPDTPPGWLLMVDAGNFRIFGAIYAAVADAATYRVTGAPTVTFTGGVANATTQAKILVVQGAFHDPREAVVVATHQLNASAQDVAYPQLTVPVDNCLVVASLWKQDDLTSVATLAGFTELSEDSTTTGDDQSLCFDYVIQTGRADIPAGSFVVTGGAAAISRGVVLAVRSDVQTFTVTRSVNGVVKSHSADDAVSLADPTYWGLTGSST